MGDYLDWFILDLLVLYLLYIYYCHTEAYKKVANLLPVSMGGGYSHSNIG